MVPPGASWLKLRLLSGCNLLFGHLSHTASTTRTLLERGHGNITENYVFLRYLRSPGSVLEAEVRLLDALDALTPLAPFWSLTKCASCPPLSRLFSFVDDPLRRLVSPLVLPLLVLSSLFNSSLAATLAGVVFGVWESGFQVGGCGSADTSCRAPRGVAVVQDCYGLGTGGGGMKAAGFLTACSFRAPRLKLQLSGPHTVFWTFPKASCSCMAR